VHSEVRCWTFNSAGYDYGHLNARTIKVENSTQCVITVTQFSSTGASKEVKETQKITQDKKCRVVYLRYKYATIM
jgi:hypothetical protein